MWHTIYTTFHYSAEFFITLLCKSSMLKSQFICWSSSSHISWFKVLNSFYRHYLEISNKHQKSVTRQDNIHNSFNQILMSQYQNTNTSSQGTKIFLKCSDAFKYLWIKIQTVNSTYNMTAYKDTIHPSEIFPPICEKQNKWTFKNLIEKQLEIHAKIKLLWFANSTVTKTYDLQCFLDIIFGRLLCHSLIAYCEGGSGLVAKKTIFIWI